MTDLPDDDDAESQALSVCTRHTRPLVASKLGALRASCCYKPGTAVWCMGRKPIEI